MQKNSPEHPKPPTITRAPPPGHGKPWKRIFAWIVFPLLVFNALFLSLQAGGISVEQENGPVENLQLLFLCCGVVLLYRAAPGPNTGVRVLIMGLALLYLSMAVRELEVRPLGLPWLTAIMKGWGRKIWLGFLWLIAAIWFWRHRLPAWQAFRAWLGSPPGLVFLAGAPLLLAAAVVEKAGFFELATSTMFAEELLELNGLWLLFLSAALMFKTYRRVSPESSPGQDGV